jgi:hypothetical protein
LTDRLGDAPIEPTFRETMNKLARTLDQRLNEPGKKTNGFILIVFPFEGREGRCNYISNANRADVVTLLKEQLARFEGMPEASGRG